MQLPKFLLQRETLPPLAALTLATGVSGGMVVLRVLWTGKFHYAFLIWNLFLAWLPLVFALTARAQFRHQTPDEKQGKRFWGSTALWLLFLPNAHYICTDLIHLTNRFHFSFWVDLTVILTCAMIGLFLGFVSTYLMQGLVVKRQGTLAGWVFVAIVSGLSSFGIYLGRFLRLNSWDVVAQPGRLLDSLSAFATGNGEPRQLTFVVLFAVFLFISYVMLYSLIHLPRTTFSSNPANTPHPQ